MGLEPTVCANFMPMNRNKQRFSRESGAIAELPPPAGVPDRVPEPCPMDTNDVRAKKVSRARQLIAQPTYPPIKVVRSLAKQIARFF
jgi:hypothetical protein